MGNLLGFIGTLESRFDLKLWAKVFAYVAALILPGPVALATVYGFWLFFRKQRRKILGLWLASLVVFYVLWFGNGATAQSYYNLPALAPLCALFGFGMREILAKRCFASWRLFATISAILLVVLPAIPVCKYLFKQDRQIFAAALWTKEHTPPSEVILFRLNHRWDMIDYPYNAAPAYYSERTASIWNKAAPEIHRARALERAHYAVVTLPQPAGRDLLAALNRFRGSPVPKPESMDWLEQAGFRFIVKEAGFMVFSNE